MNSVADAYKEEITYRPPDSSIFFESSATLQYLGLKTLVACKENGDALAC